MNRGGKFQVIRGRRFYNPDSFELAETLMKYFAMTPQDRLLWHVQLLRGPRKIFRDKLLRG